VLVVNHKEPGFLKKIPHALQQKEGINLRYLEGFKIMDNESN